MQVSQMTCQTDLMGCKKHRGVKALSSTESEIIQATETFKELLWLQPLLVDIGFQMIESMTAIHEDTQPDYL